MLPCGERDHGSDIVAARGVPRSKLGPDRPGRNPLDQNFEYAKTGDRAGSIRSGLGLIRFPLGSIRVLDRLDRK